LAIFAEANPYKIFEFSGYRTRGGPGKLQNYPIQDEPGEEVRFQYIVSLGGGFDSNTG
jgi:hypothetical protein